MPPQTFGADFVTKLHSRLVLHGSLICLQMRTNNHDQWSTIEDILEQIARETQQELKRNKPKQQATSTSNNSTNQATRNIRSTGTRSQTPSQTNLSNYQLSKHQITLLTKGLNFIPTPKMDHPAKILQDILLYARKIRLKHHFYQKPPFKLNTSLDNN